MSKICVPAREVVGYKPCNPDCGGPTVHHPILCGDKRVVIDICEVSSAASYHVNEVEYTRVVMKTNDVYYVSMPFDQFKGRSGIVCESCR